MNEDDQWRERLLDFGVDLAGSSEPTVEGLAGTPVPPRRRTFRTLLLILTPAIVVAAVVAIVLGIGATADEPFTFSLGEAPAAEGTWAQLPLSGNGGNVTSVAVDPNDPQVVFAMTDNGLFKSTDGAQSWTQLLKRDGNLIMPEVSVLPDSSSTLLIFASGLFGDVLRRSEDGGVSWENLGWPDLVPVSWNGRTIGSFDLGSGPFIYVTESTDDAAEPDHSRDRIWCSYDRGETWVEATGSDREQLIVARDEADDIVIPIDPETGAKLFSLAPPAVDPTHPSIMYAGTPRGVYKSENGGETWKKASEGLTASAVAGLVVDPGNASTLYATTGEGIFKSIDGGQAWSLILGGGSPGNVLEAVSLVVAPSSPSTLYAWTSGGLFRSDDGGAAWRQAAAQGLLADSGFHLSADLCAVSSSDANVVVAATENGIVRTADGGETWASVYGSEGKSMVCRVERAPDASSTMYASVLGMGLKPGAEAAFEEAAADDEETDLSGWMEQEFSLLKSTDEGATWTALAADHWRGYTIDFEIDPYRPTTLYALQMGLSGGESLFGGITVSRSEDGGKAWSDAKSSGNARAVLQLLLDARTKDAMYVLAAGGLMQATSVYRSTDGGKSWSDITGELKGETLTQLYIDPATESGLYATSSTGLYRWTPDSD